MEQSEIYSTGRINGIERRQGKWILIRRIFSARPARAQTKNQFGQILFQAHTSKPLLFL
jgi:hypothetical protein